MNQAKVPVLAILYLFISCHLSAQTGRITGKVWNVESNTPLPGASVVLTEAGGKDAQRGVSTDVEGQFFLAAEKGKYYRLTVSGVGLVSRTVDSVTVNANATPITIMVSTNRASLQQVVVSTSARRASVAGLYAIQKNSSAISDGISADLIRRSPDRNTGDVLKRVSGASVQENKFVVIRGMNERYNVALLNNALLPSTEADKKAFAFNIIPSSLVDNLTIYKAATPDLPGDFSGGAVKVQTKDFPGQPISELSVSIGVNSKTTGKNFYKGKPDGKYDWLGYLDNSRLIPGPYYRQRGADFIKNSAAYKREVTKLFPNTFGSEAAKQSLPAISVQYTGGNTRLLPNGRKLGTIFSVGYGTGRAVSDRDRDEYDINRVFQFGFNSMNYEEKNNLSALLSMAYSYGKSKIAWKTVYYNEFVKTLAHRDGYNRVNDPNFFYSKGINNEVSQNGLIHSVLEGSHRPGKGWAIDWTGGVGYTYRNQPDQKILAFRSADNVDANYSITLSNENSPAIRTAGRVYSFLHEAIYNGGLSVSKTFQWGEQVQKWQVGTLNVYRDRSVEVSALGYAGIADAVVIQDAKDIDFNNLLTASNIDKYNLTVANIANNSTDYTANAMLNAGYALMENRFSDRLKATWGVRVERYHQKLAALNKTPIDKSNTDVLPSLLLTYAVNNKTNLRLSGSRAVNRPEFRELASYAVYDYDNNQSITGNPALKRAQNTNADLRYEFFPQAGEILSASLFYKHFTDPIEQTNLGNDNLSYANASSAYVYGAELEIRKKLDFTGSDLLSHITAYVNAAYIKGGVQFDTLNIKSPMQGQSPYLINAGLYYLPEGESWSFNLLYNRIGPRLQFRAVRGGAFNIFESPRDVVDVQVSKKLLKGKLEAKLTLSDLFAQPFRWYYKYDPAATHVAYDPAKDAIIRSFTFGTTATLGLRYHFQ